MLLASECLDNICTEDIEQALLNLLSNAVKFTNQGNITFGYKLRGGDIYFYMTDIGCGIPKDKQTLIFDRFVKQSSFVQGTGWACTSASILSARWAGI